MSDFSSKSLDAGLGMVVAGGESKVDGMEGLLKMMPSEGTQQKAARAAKKAAKPAGTDDKRRGPNSHRVRDMFAAVGTERVPLDALIKKHCVSVHVARQSKRFDPHRDRGQIVIKTLPDETTGEKCTYIWRVANK